MKLNILDVILNDPDVVCILYGKRKEKPSILNIFRSNGRRQEIYNVGRCSQVYHFFKKRCKSKKILLSKIKLSLSYYDLNSVFAVLTETFFTANTQFSGFPRFDFQFNTHNKGNVKISPSLYCPEFNGAGPCCTAPILEFSCKDLKKIPSKIWGDSVCGILANKRNAGDSICTIPGMLKYILEELFGKNYNKEYELLTEIS